MNATLSVSCSLRSVLPACWGISISLSGKPADGTRRYREPAAVVG
ncbi:MAG: hypothetical protein ACIAZJ_26440 [Gimesia chilikensis]